MRTKKPEKKKRYFIKGPKFNEVSSVGKGANQGAHVSFLKVEDTKELAKQSFIEAMTEMGMTQELRNMMRVQYRKSSALSRAFESILMNPEIKDKKTQMKTSLQQFLSSVMSDIEDATIIKEVKSILEPNSKDKTKKKKKKEKEDMDADALKKTVDEMQVRLVKSEKLAEMTDVQKGFYNTLSEKAQADFLKKSCEEMDEAIEVEKAADEVIEINGQEIKKSDVGDAGFSVLKAQALINKSKDDRIDALEKSIKEDKATTLKKELMAKAEAEFPNLPGTPEEKAEVLKGLENLGEEAKAAAYAMLKSSNTSAEHLYKEIGAANPVLTNIQKSANSQLEKIAADFQKADPNLTKAAAITKAMKTPAGMAIYNKADQAA